MKDHNDMMLAMDQLEWTVKALRGSTTNLSARLHKLIAATVRAHQESRLAKNYLVSDLLRAILNEAGIEIVQGTAGYAYEDIPPALKGRPVHDTWRIK